MQRVNLAFLHGFMGHPSDWDEVRRQLEARCHASSTAVDLETCAIAIQPAENWEASLQQLAERTPPDSVLVGYSMGARLALGLTLEFPKRFRGLVFISGSPGLETEAAREQRSAADERVADRLESQPVAEFLTEWYQQAVFSTVPKAITQSEVEYKLRHASQTWPAVLRANSVASQPNYWEQLHRLQIPMLAIVGDLDAKYRTIALRLADESAGKGKATSIVLPDCGHIVHREQPEALVEALAEFIERLETT